MRIVRNLTAVLFFISVFANSTIAAEHSIEDYGQLPFVRSVSISPDGKHFAFIRRSNSGDFFIIADAETQELVGAANASQIKARSVYFATNEHVILVISKTTGSYQVRGKWENSAAIVYDLNTKKMKTLLQGSKGLYPVQTGLGKIVGLNLEKELVYMPAYIGEVNPKYHLTRVNLNHHLGRIHAKGTEHTIDWFVDREGNVLAKEEYQESKREHRVYARHGKKWVKVFSEETSVPSVSFGAVSADRKYLLFTRRYNNHDAVFKLSLEDGEIVGPLYVEENTDIDRILTYGLSREFRGVKYAGLLPNYVYEDDLMDQAYAVMLEIYSGSSVHQVSATENGSKIVYQISGNEEAGRYVILDTVERKMSGLGSKYPEVGKESIGKIEVVRYTSGDGLPIQAIVTWPVGVEDRSNLPMLVLPHGGPESYDSIQFDWWAQYFARSGYVVFQPNFRGSTGSGVDFVMAGRGEWGRKMQDDISDGVAAMIKAGHVDASRICIMGASYGGYAALAGGAFTPDLYKCVISVAGVSDLTDMLAGTKHRYGRNHWVVSYWNDVIGDSKTEREKLKTISPIHFASEFRAPVLMLHGRDDTVVPIAQSRRMLRALEKAKKPVELITLKGEDHWLSDSDTRLHLLKSISEFLQVHNPAGMP